MPQAVLIAPVGNDYSAISDDSFAYYQGMAVFKELTIEEYVAWLITANSLSAYFAEYRYDGVMLAESDLTMRRYHPNTNELIAYPSLAPCEFAGVPLFYTNFKQTPLEEAVYDNTLPRLVWGQFSIFFHRGGFYMVMNSSVNGPQSNPNYTDSWTFTSTNIRLETTYDPPGSDPPFLFREYEYTLNV